MLSFGHKNPKLSRFSLTFVSLISMSRLAALPVELVLRSSQISSKNPSNHFQWLSSSKYHPCDVITKFPNKGQSGVSFHVKNYVFISLGQICHNWCYCRWWSQLICIGTFVWKTSCDVLFIIYKGKINTVWKFSNFPATLILREINLDFRRS